MRYSTPFVATNTRGLFSRHFPWGPSQRSAGLPAGLRVNDLRHSAVSFAVAHGANVYAVQRMVGHSKPSITLDVYGELWDDSQEQLAGQLDAAIRAESAALSQGAAVELAAAQGMGR